jgi:hypothetical protein
MPIRYHLVCNKKTAAKTEVSIQKEKVHEYS